MMLMSRYRAYARSKLCNVLHTSELQRRLGPAGIHAFSVSPGVVNTGMTANMLPSLKWLMRPLLQLFSQSPAQVRTHSIRGISRYRKTCVSAVRYHALSYIIEYIPGRGMRSLCNRQKHCGSHILSKYECTMTK